MAWIGLAVDMAANLVMTGAGSILIYRYEFTSLVAYILLVVGAFGSLHVSFYEMFQVKEIDSKETDEMLHRHIKEET